MFGTDSEATVRRHTGAGAVAKERCERAWDRALLLAVGRGRLSDEAKLFGIPVGAINGRGLREALLEPLGPGGGLGVLERRSELGEPELAAELERLAVGDAAVLEAAAQDESLEIVAGILAVEAQLVGLGRGVGGEYSLVESLSAHVERLVDVCDHGIGLRPHHFWHQQVHVLNDGVAEALGASISLDQDPEGGLDDESLDFVPAGDGLLQDVVDVLIALNAGFLVVPIAPPQVTLQAVPRVR